MKKLLILFAVFYHFTLLNSQIVTLTPGGAGPDDKATLIFDATQGNGELVGAQKVYVHHGLVTDSPSGTDWQYVIGNWGMDDGIGQMTRVEGEDNKWKIEFDPTIRQYFGVPENEEIFRISCVFRSADGNTKGTIAPGDYGWGTVTSNRDIYIDLNIDNYISITQPEGSESYLKQGEGLMIEAQASSSVSTMKILLDEGGGFNEVASISTGTSIQYEYNPSATVNLGIKVTATVNGEDLEAFKNFNVIIQNESEVAPLPAGVIPGINYHENDDTKVTLVLEAPGKTFGYVVGDFTDWVVEDNYQMKKTPDGEHLWLEITGLTSGQEYAFQYWVDGEIKVADAYADKLADPWNDPFIEQSVYPDIHPYDRAEYGIASILQTGQEAYIWSATEETWERPDINHLMIYELHIRDFLASHSYKDLIDTLPYLKRLGIQAIELMPVNEFEGNDSWGYNPSFFFAPDKYYGPKNELKKFVEKAHETGLAVIMDIVLNHAYLQNPMVQMYFDYIAFKPTNDNPWFNREYVGQYQWGFDFNHESSYTQRFIDRVNRYWLEEYHFDGFRFDFTKGFTNYAPGGSVDGYDASRIELLKRMADQIWNVDPETYIILEHWAPFQEEQELGNYGMKMWSNRSYDYVPATIGNPTGSFNDMERETHVTFFNSHDERRIAEHVLSEGRSGQGINLKDTIVMYERVKMAAAFAFLYPGPKMMWQFDELGYDIDINFNGRVGRKPYAWGPGSLMYYEDSLRQHIYSAYEGILHVRNTITPQALANAATNHKETGQTRRLTYDTDDIDLVLIGNFGLSKADIDPAFPDQGKWYNYFDGDSLEVIDPNEEISLQSGEWRIYTSQKLSAGMPGVVEVYSNPVTVSPFPFTKTDEIKLTFDATKAFPGQTSGLIGAEKVYFHSGVVTASPLSDELGHIVGTLNDDGIGLMTKISTDLWQISFTPGSYYDIVGDQPIYKIGMYFRDAGNDNVGLGFRNQLIYVNVSSGGEILSIDPPMFDIDTEITITFDATQGNRELVGSDKVYMHSSIGTVDTDAPQNSAWNNVVGNWGQDDGIGQMSKVNGTTDQWRITLTPGSYYGLSTGDYPYWLAAVFRNADGSKKGTGQPGELSNGFIADNQDFFIRNGATSSSEDLEIITGAAINPNPSSGYLDLSDFEAGMVFTLFTTDGREVFRTILEGSKIYTLDSLTKGLYFYFISGDRKYQSGKVIIQ